MCLRSRVPLRVGVACGSFAALRFRSDVGYGSDDAAQFLGTAVVRSCAAEGCGVKGMRNLIHPSVEATMRAPNQSSSNVGASYLCLPLFGPEKQNKTGVRYELDYWPSKIGEKERLWASLQDMWTAAPEAFAEHYQSTAEAIQRMREHHNEPVMTNLRRRTLPRLKG